MFLFLHSWESVLMEDHILAKICQRVLMAKKISPDVKLA